MSNDPGMLDGLSAAVLRTVGDDDMLWAAVTVVQADGETDFFLVSATCIQDETIVYDATCPEAAHEKLEPSEGESTGEGRGIIDAWRSCVLHDVGGSHTFAATLIWPDFKCVAILDADLLHLGVRIDAQCRGVETRHEQLGPLPEDIVEQIDAAQLKFRRTDEHDE